MIIVILAAVGANLLFIATTFAAGASPKRNGFSAAGTVLTAEQQELQEARKDQKARHKERENHIIWSDSRRTGGSLSSVILDSYDAQDVLETIQNELGVDADNEYYVTNHTKNSDFEIYTLQQKYNGVDVYGYQLKMVTDLYGNLVSVNGEHLPVYDLPEMNYGYYDCADLVERYLKQTYGYSDGDFWLDGLGERIVPYDKNNPSVCYVFEVYGDSWDSAFERIFVDASTGQISGDDLLLDDEMVSEVLQGQRTNHQTDVWRASDTRYELRDSERNIRVGTANSTNISSFNASTQIEWNPLQDIPNRSGVDALANLQTIYDYYLDTYGRQGITGNYDELNVVVDVTYFSGRNFVDNAAMSGTNNMLVGFRSTSVPTYAADLDVMGHETFHGITNAESGLLMGTYSFNRQNSIQLAIGEGLADVYGELVEDYSDDHTYNGSCSWDSEVRSMSNPESHQGDSRNANDFVEGITNCHHGAAVVTYPVYAMFSGADIGTDKTIDAHTLGMMYYNTLPMLTAQTDFAEFRRVIEDYALRMNAGKASISLSDKQVEGVLDAMDTAGIERSYDLSLTPGAALEVYNAENKIDTTYHISILKRHGQEIVSQDVDSERAYLQLEPGVYDVLLTDKETGLIYVFTMAINDNAQAQLTEDYQDVGRVFTEFESTKNNIALVLDTSGSMSGTPMEETKKAGVNFIDTIFDMAPNVEISLVTYEDDSAVELARSSDAAALKGAIRSLYSGGSTNMYAGMNDGFGQLSGAQDGKSIMVVMSDGLPNEGQTSGNSYSDAVIQLADQVKASGITVFSLGFFHNSSGSDLSEGIALMEAIASEGYHYNVQDAGNIDFIFNEIGKQIGGTKYIYIRVACPVDVTVTSGGETLSSDPDNRQTSAGFGSLTFEGEDDTDNVKIFRLNADSDYELWISGTGSGLMDVTVSYPNTEGVYDDVRYFEDIAVNPGMFASLSTAAQDSMSLDVDSNGDGRFDKSYQAGHNSTATESGNNLALWHGLGITAVIIIIGLLWLKQFLDFGKAGRTCPNCGSQHSKKAEFCGICGMNLERSRGSYGQFVKESFTKFSGWVPHLIVIIALLVITSIHGSMYASSRQIIDQLNEGRLVTAQTVYRAAVDGRGLTESYANAALRSYRSSVEKQAAAGTFGSAADAQAMIAGIDSMLNSTYSQAVPVLTPSDTNPGGGQDPGQWNPQQPGGNEWETQPSDPNDWETLPSNPDNWDIPSVNPNDWDIPSVDPGQWDF